MSFDPKTAAEQIHKAIKGMGTDDKTLIQAVVHRHPDQTAAIYSTYASVYGKVITKDIQGDTSGNYGRLLKLAVLPRDVLVAKLIRRAVKGMGTNDKLLIDVAASVLPHEAASAASVYQTRYGRDIIKAIKGDTTGSYEDLLVEIFKGTRAAEAAPDLTLAKKDAALIKNQSGMSLAKTLVPILGRYSRAQIAATAAAFRKDFGKDIDDHLTRALTGKFELLARAVVESTRYSAGGGVPPIGQLCKAIRKSIKGLGTDDERLRSCAAMAAPYYPFMPDAYKHLTKADLSKDIKGDTTQNYEKLLLAMLGCDSKQGIPGQVNF